ncbi:MAG: ATP-binding protein [Proteobacteria bacterium]|nr:ATP-binding protein [Pseudomonadota bacterium]
MTAGLINKYGPWVSGEHFFDREAELKHLIGLLDEGNSILIVAPRRVGKTSLVREAFRRMEERGQDDLLFVDVQDCSSPQDVIVSLSLAAQPYTHLWTKVTDTFTVFFRQVESVQIPDTFGIKLREGLTGDWQAKGQTILHNLSQTDKPLTICLDELPIMLSRLLQPTTSEPYPSKREAADVFLSWLRQMMLQHQDKLRFIVCGSIGLEPILKRHRLSHTITQLRPFPLEPWNRETAESCLNALAECYGLEWERASLNMLLNKLGSYIPHHVQMFFGMLYEDCEKRKNFRPASEDVNRVYQSSMLSTRGHAELATYDERLQRVLEREAVPLALDLLTEAAMADGLKVENARLLMQRAELADGEALLSEVLDVLIHDGYLAWNEDRTTLRFVSSLVRDWWKRSFELKYRPL